MNLNEVHVVTSFIMHEGRVLILKRSGKVRTMKHKWAGISGYVEEGEMDDILKRAYREIEEEVGIASKHLRLVSECTTVKVVDEENSTVWIVHPFLFLLNNDVSIRLDWEHDEYRWVRPEDIELYDTVPMLKEALKGCLNTSTNP